MYTYFAWWLYFERVKFGDLTPICQIRQSFWFYGIQETELPACTERVHVMVQYEMAQKDKLIITWPNIARCIDMWKLKERGIKRGERLCNSADTSNSFIVTLVVDVSTHLHLCIPKAFFMFRTPNLISDIKLKLNSKQCVYSGKARFYCMNW